MIMNESKFNITKILIEGVLYNYSTRKDNYVSLRSILGDFSNNILRRAIRNVMFDKHIVLELVYDTKDVSRVKTKTMWVLKSYEKQIKKEATTDYLSFITKLVIREEMKLKQMIYSLHGWKLCDTFQIEVNKDTIKDSFETFKEKYSYMITKLSSDLEYHDKLMEVIYDYGINVRLTANYITELNLQKRNLEKKESIKELLEELMKKLNNL